jgi:RsiW-degrading membrane proteinase PrsW (M82 family)
MKKYTIIVLIPTILIIILIHIIVPEPNKNDMGDYIDKAFATKNYRIARKESWRLIKTDFTNIKYHLDYIYANHKSSRKRDLTPYYLSYHGSPDSEIADLAIYALGYIKMLAQDETAALNSFLKVKNIELKYLNNSIGLCYSALKEYEKAKYYLRREIELNGYVHGALNNYAEILIREKNIPEINRLLAHPELRKEIIYHNKRQFYYLTRDVYSYFATILKSQQQHIIIEGIIGALLITVIWFIFVRRLDIFEPEKMKYLLLALVLSAVISEFTYLLYDFSAITLQFRLEGSPAHEFFYCVMGIGLIEEAIKIIPVLLIFFFTKEINEPVDFIIFAAVAALGFAFIENLGYFDNSGLTRITGRAMTATMMHMVLSTISIYGLVLYRFKKSSSIWILAFFLTACFLHGLYDFGLLTTSSMQLAFWFISVFLLILSLIIFNQIIRNTLANSKFCHIGNGTERLRQNVRLVIYNISYIFVVQYAILAIKFGVELADPMLDYDLIFTYIYICVLSVCLNRFKLKQGDWHC